MTINFYFLFILQDELNKLIEEGHAKIDKEKSDDKKESKSKQTPTTSTATPEKKKDE